MGSGPGGLIIGMGGVGATVAVGAVGRDGEESEGSAVEGIALKLSVGTGVGISLERMIGLPDGSVVSMIPLTVDGAGVVEGWSLGTDGVGVGGGYGGGASLSDGGASV